MREFVETFAYQFMHGANSERVSKSKELFYLFLDTLRDSDISHRDEIGGHSAVWAVRAQIEGCKVFTAAQSNPVIDSQLPLTHPKSNPLLLWPKDKISMENDKQDLHLVFEYAEGDSILNGRFVAPRSNRFYFVHDPNGGKLKQLETYHEIAEKDHPEIKRHLFGGYQLL